MRDNYTEWGRYTHPDPDEEIRFWKKYKPFENLLSATTLPILFQQMMPLCEDPVEDKGSRVSYLLWDVGIDIPRYQLAILKLVEAIRVLSELERTEEQIRAGRLEDKLELWKSLERFEYVWDWWPARHGLYYPFNGPNEYHNAQAFYAHHLATYPPDSTDSSCELAAAFQLVMFALEQDPWNYANISRLDVPTDHMQMLNSDVHGMVPFFEVSGHIIFRFLGKYDLSAIEKLNLPECNLWEGDSSFSMERWEFWKTRLRWVSEQDGLLEITRDDARKIVHLMQEIEQQAQGMDPVG
ncbi:uncharacterized protein N7483_005085 [Penicillium malachiteum]|uniref:uncharacterized protein n=1 Tax=Penicillium malachiteum TaxID=1324776 RepID=UPI002546FC8B|nr:uncharacterized protein N7483_005085 [Penicillium malachiteum]KAJ5730577.1 hypothetical protein N7483_005085 [Penicillium malachiteum]